MSYLTSPHLPAPGTVDLCFCLFAAWSDLTGYKYAEVAGKTCSFLQGPHTKNK